MEEHVIRHNTRTGELRAVAHWPTDGSAGADAHERNRREKDPQVEYVVRSSSWVRANADKLGRITEGAAI